MTDHQFRVLRRFIIGVIVVMLLGIGNGWWTSYQGRVALRNSQLAGCERGKLDRAANAAGWTAQHTYITKVTAAASVKEDVKRAARAANKTYRRTSAELTKRAHLDCSKAFPAPSLLPDIP